MSDIFDNLGGIGGNGLLDDVFCGTDGISSLLHGDFGGEITIIVPGEPSTWNEETFQHEGGTNDGKFISPFLAGLSKRDAGRTSIDGIEILSGDLVGTMPTDETGYVLGMVAGKTFVVHDGRMYQVLGIEKTFSGNKVAMITIVARK